VANARLHTAEILKSYEILRAPFNGMVTSRFADPGALVQNAMTSQTSALPVVTVSTVDRLRVDVFVDQHDASYVVKDEDIAITLTDRPGFKILGKVSRVSGALDPRTKMLLTEIDLKNDQQQLVAGSFVQVSINIKSPPYLEAPVESLVMRGEKSFLTALTADNLVQFRPVDVSNNDGKMLWITSGVVVGERVALNIGDTIPEGGKVRPIDEGLKTP
jgi:membrane fusion protein (multidrug efflux system)